MDTRSNINGLEELQKTLWARKSSLIFFLPLNKLYIFNCMDEIFLCGNPKGTLKFHAKYLIHTLIHIV